MANLHELDELVAELDLDRRRQQTGPSTTGGDRRPIITTQFFDACPRCHSKDVATNKGRGFSICETCGFAVDPTNRVSAKQRQAALQPVSQATRDKLAMLQVTRIAHNHKMLQETEQANWELFHAAQENDIKTLKRLLDLGYDINVKDTDTGSTPLLWAASKSQQHAIRFLVERGANINCQNKKGFTPLHSLIVNRVEPLAFWLIKKGADIRITNNEGHTPVDLALPWTQKEMEELYLKVKSGEIQTGNEPTPPVVRQSLRIGDNAVPQATPDPQEKEVMRVFLKNDAYKSIIVGPTSTAQDLCDQMADKLGLGVEFSRNFEVFERVKNGEQIQERRIPPTAVIMNLKNKWPLIFGKSGNETHLHCKFIVHTKNGVSQDAQTKFRSAMYGATSG